MCEWQALETHSGEHFLVVFFNMPGAKMLKFRGLYALEAHSETVWLRRPDGVNSILICA
jgi:hypothetical protein